MKGFLNRNGPLFFLFGILLAPTVFWLLINFVFSRS